MRSFLITAAGPAIQIVLGLVALFIFRQSSGLSLTMATFLQILYWISIFWALLNLLPIIPLDGGRLMESLFGSGRIRITLIISFVTAATVCIYSISLKSYYGAMMFGMFAFRSFKALQQLAWH